VRNDLSGVTCSSISGYSVCHSALIPPSRWRRLVPWKKPISSGFLTSVHCVKVPPRYSGCGHCFLQAGRHAPRVSGLIKKRLLPPSARPPIRICKNSTWDGRSVVLSTKNFTRTAPLPEPKPEPEPEVEPPSFAQSRSNGYIRIRLQGAVRQPEPEPFIRPPSRSQLMSLRGQRPR
jgi:hypothetical protein